MYVSTKKQSEHNFNKSAAVTTIPNEQINIPRGSNEMTKSTECKQQQQVPTTCVRNFEILNSSGIILQHSSLVLRDEHIYKSWQEIDCNETYATKAEAVAEWYFQFAGSLRASL